MVLKCAMAALIALCISAVSARAQSVAVGAAIHKTIQRFDGDPSLNRLDGESLGWTIGGSARLGQWVVRCEGSRDGIIRNAQSTTLTVSGRSLSIDSELSHDMHEVAALGGYALDFTKRFEVAVLGGVSAVTVHRAFTTNAGQLVLIPPSTFPTGPVTTTFADRFATWTAEVNVVVHATRHVGVTAGVRTQPISLADDLAGRFFRPFAGVAWQFR
jgi:hypothetical protein